MAKKKTNFRKAVRKNVEKQNQAASGYGYLGIPTGVDMFVPKKEGKIRLDFMPYIVSDTRHPDRDDEFEIAVPGGMWYRRPFKIHRNIGGEDGESIICPTTFGKPCPICEYRKKRAMEGAEKDELSELNTSKRCLYVVIPIDSKEAGIHVWDVSEFLFQKLLNKELEENEDYAVFPDLEEGLTIAIRFEEKSFAKNTYFQANRIDFEERDSIYDEAIMKDIPDLDKMLTLKSYAEIEALFLQIDMGDVVDEDNTKEEEETPATTHRKAKTILKTEKVAETVEGEETQEEETQEECPVVEEKPVRKVISKPKAEKETTKKQEPKGENECPNGYTFGEDVDTKAECADCPVWDACIDAS